MKNDNNTNDKTIKTAEIRKNTYNIEMIFKYDQEMLINWKTIAVEVEKQW